MGRFAARTAAACGSQWLVHSFALPPGRRGEALRLPNYRAPALAAATAAPSALCFALAVPPTAVTCTCPWAYVAGRAAITATISSRKR